MSYVSPAAGGAQVPVRRVYYLRGVGTDVDKTFYVNDQFPGTLPSEYLLQVSAMGGASTVLAAAGQMPGVCEVRLYGAFTSERVFDMSSASPVGNYLILGYLTASGAPSGNGTGVSFYPAAPVECRAMNGAWRIQLYNVVTGATYATTVFNGWTFAVDVRAGDGYPRVR